MKILYMIAGFFLVLFRRSPRWMMQFCQVTGPDSYQLQKHMFAFRRLAEKNMQDLTTELLSHGITGWSLFLFDTATGKAVTYIGAHNSSAPHLLMSKPDGTLN